jgi:hypothetical protein
VSHAQVRRAELTTDHGSHAQLRRAELVTTGVATAKAQLRRAELITVPAPAAQLRRAELITVVALAANAGADQSVDSLDRVFLTGLASSGDPYPTLFSWSQTAGPPVTLLPNAFSPQPSFIAPATAAGTTCTFVLTVGDGTDTSPSSAPVDIDVAPHIHWVGVAGGIRPALLNAGV